MAEVLTMDAMWLIPIAALLFFVWAGWTLRKRSANRPGQDAMPRDPHSYYDGR